MSEFKDILPQAKIICSNFDLCDLCLGRLYSKKLHLKSNSLLGKKIRSSIKIAQCKKCYICKGTFSHLDVLVQKLIQTTSDFQFKTFEIGTILKPSILDNDDFIRSKYKMKGVDSIKSDIAKEISRLFSKRTKSQMEHTLPDITLTINLKDESVSVRTKPIYLSGRYTKKNRGLPQKQGSCEKCLGKGCQVCDFHGISGFDSVEGLISQYVFGKFGCEQIKFTWIGGEDQNSLVLGSGRPFFLKLINPKKQKSTLPELIYLDGITIKNFKLIKKMPKTPIRFISKIICTIICDKMISQNDLKTIKNELATIIVYENSGRRSEKSIKRVVLKQISPDSFKMTFWGDGGIPIKRFIEGDNVSPNISDLLNMSCRCKDFDFLEIRLK